MAKAPRKSAAKPAKPATTQAAESSAKSIISSKYRESYKDRAPDWLRDLITANVSVVEKIKRKIKDDEGTRTVTEEKVTGIDVPALFAVAEKNSLNVDKFRGKEGDNGFAGRFRMSVGNMLRAAAKQRHGIYDKKGAWQAAPEDWLKASGAPAETTHDRKGQKHVKPAPAAKTPKASTEATASA